MQRGVQASKRRYAILKCGSVAAQAAVSVSRRSGRAGLRLAMYLRPVTLRYAIDIPRICWQQPMLCTI